MMLRAIIAACAAILAAGCVYKGGKVVDGTNLAIGMKIPGTEWSVSVLDYIGGVRVAGQDSTHITVTHDVAETNTYFGVVTTSRRSKLTADIEPLADGGADDDKQNGTITVQTKDGTNATVKYEDGQCLFCEDCTTSN